MYQPQSKNHSVPSRWTIHGKIQIFPLCRKIRNLV